MDHVQVPMAGGGRRASVRGRRPPAGSGRSESTAFPSPPFGAPPRSACTRDYVPNRKQGKGAPDQQQQPDGRAQPSERVRRDSENRKIGNGHEYDRAEEAAEERDDRPRTSGVPRCHDADRRRDDEDLREQQRQRRKDLITHGYIGLPTSNPKSCIRRPRKPKRGCHIQNAPCKYSRDRGGRGSAPTVAGPAGGVKGRYSW